MGDKGLELFELFAFFFNHETKSESLPVNTAAKLYIPTHTIGIWIFVQWKKNIYYFKYYSSSCISL